MNHFNRTTARRVSAVSLAAMLMAAPSPSFAHEYKAGDLEIAHPWSRATLPGAKVAAGYLVIKNDGDTADTLLSVESNISASGEIHEMKVTDGVMVMRPLSAGLVIPAHGEVKLEPGSYHIMFTSLKGPAIEGVKFAGKLVFEKAGSVDVEFAVDEAGGSEDHSAHGK